MLARYGGRALVVGDPEAARVAPNRIVIDVGNIPEFSQVRVTGRRVSLGAGARFGHVLRDIVGENGLVRQAISMMANPLVRNRVTVLEGLDPASHYFDLSTTLLALDSRVRIQSTSGSRSVSIADFLLEAAGEPKPGEFPSEVHFQRLGPDRRVGFFRVNPGPSKNTVSAAIITGLRRNVAFEPQIFVSSSTLIPVFAPLASKVMSRRLLSDNNVKMIAEQAAAEIMALTGVEKDAYESSLIEVAVSRAIRRVNEAPVV